MTYKKMTIADWIQVEDNPIQRNTEQRAATAHHLFTPSPTHSFVFAVELPSGKLVKLDGHTRALLWKRKQVQPPPFVLVGIIPAKDRAEAEELYQHFDSKNALETMRDKVAGAFNRHNFKPQSGLVRSGNLTTALRMAYGVLVGLSANSGLSGTKGGNQQEVSKADVYLMIDEFSLEIHALDGFGLGQGRLPSGGIAAFLLSMRRHGSKVTPFWQAVFGNGGEKSGGYMDGVQAAYELIERRDGYGGSASFLLCAKLLAAIDKWLNDELLGRLPSPINTRGYLAGHERPLERLLKKADLKKAA